MTAEQPATPGHARPRSHGRRGRGPSPSVGARVARAVTVLVSVFCLLVTGVGWSLFSD